MSGASVLEQPILTEVADGDLIKIKVAIKPKAGKKGKTYIVVEATEEGGQAIAQSAFKVTVSPDESTAIANKNAITPGIYPNPANEHINVKGLFGKSCMLGF